ncbi:HAD family hydrolase [Anaerocolumna sp. AGMB13020]|uniref:HAD family hydrolase n=1 Tax=Anaerocolumna sp. AGMB13020 TaxID=3081750 RepID=UPI0029529C13|nr:HAD family hydrolase [Anaerocolumna sp. AGMB13020]WOO39019.1 HAD family hydrolase [Anaerocolumna sp. AGMB13020]
MMNKKYILFDLDGTITDPEEGITKSLQYALSHIGIKVEDRSILKRHIGPPLAGGLREFFGLDDIQIEEVIGYYREYFVDKGIFMNIKYEGIEELLESLVKAGKILIVATSKPEIFAERIFKHFNLEQYFTDICGSNLDETRSKKGEVIAYALEENGIKEKDQVVMIGDRLHDILGAKENGIASIGVLYGFGSRDELLEAGADKIAADLNELKDILLECDR